MNRIATPTVMEPGSLAQAVMEPPISTGGEGNKVVVTAGTPLQLSVGGLSTPVTGVAITARIGNTKQVAVGFSNAVRATAGAEVGMQLQPGASLIISISDLSFLWIDAQVNGEGVSYTYTTN